MSANNTSNREENNNASLFKMGAGIAAGVAAFAGGVYFLTRGPSTGHSSSGPQASSSSSPVTSARVNTSRVTSYISNLIDRVAVSQSTMAYPSCQGGRGISSRDIPPNPVVNNLNSLLSDIHVRFIALRMEDFSHHYRVFDIIFQRLHQNMKVVCPYYRKYSSTVQFAGSHYDRLRIKKPDEFDMDIVIDLPLNLNSDPWNPMESDIIIEPKTAGFVQLKMGVQFQRLPMRDGAEWQNNKPAFQWKDECNYLLRSNFQNWFKGVVNKALNLFGKQNNFAVFEVDGVPYRIRFASEAGPAMTLSIENSSGFKMDVDLVPALKFPENRWPIARGYRQIPPDCRRDYWMVVGKPNKAAQSLHDTNRSWRLALHNQERELMHNSYNLRQGIRLLKKLRDAQGMDAIASYYIKTLFFWEIEKQSQAFWRNNNPAAIFKLMVQRFHEAMVHGSIPYYWNTNNNLIAHVQKGKLAGYAAKLAKLKDVLQNAADYRSVATFLLTSQEYDQYKSCIY